MIREPKKGNPFVTNFVESVVFTIGAEISNVKNVSMQFKDLNVVNMAGRVAVDAYLSDNSDGSTLTASAPTTTLVGSAGLSIPLIATKAFKFVTNALGVIDVNITYATGAGTWYLVVVMPDGSLSVSSAITFA